ncbi:hypothetical protein PLICRDRAFT_514811 [Plicaturopsis crispa FD-325 SS-3]|nr:hypothetical protein PLICRDRAFT_514811 [Plicaturopsis crispa FD-325 SS-3]
MLVTVLEHVQTPVPAFPLASGLLCAALPLLFLLRVLPTFVLFPATAVIVTATVHIRRPQHRVERDERRVQDGQERAHDVGCLSRSEWVRVVCGSHVCIDADTVGVVVPRVGAASSGVGVVISRANAVISRVGIVVSRVCAVLSRVYPVYAVHSVLNVVTPKDYAVHSGVGASTSEILDSSLSLGQKVNWSALIGYSEFAGS